MSNLIQTLNATKGKVGLAKFDLMKTSQHVHKTEREGGGNIQNDLDIPLTHIHPLLSLIFNICRPSVLWLRSLQLRGAAEGRKKTSFVSWCIVCVSSVFCSA